MKKIISAVLVCVLLVGVVFMLASCANVDEGTYIGENGTVVEISGNKYITKLAGDESTTTHTFEIKDSDTNAGKKEIHLTVVDSDIETFKYSYEKLDDGFVVGGIKYTKQ